MRAVCSTSEASKVFDVVKKLDMTTSGYVWIVSEQALKAPNCPDGKSTIRSKQTNISINAYEFLTMKSKIKYNASASKPTFGIRQRP